MSAFKIIMDGVKKAQIPENPLNRMMRDRGLDPEEWFLVMPIEMDGREGCWPADTVFSVLVTSPLLIKKSIDCSTLHTCEVVQDVIK
jgi:hypothetical protein